MSSSWITQHDCIVGVDGREPSPCTWSAWGDWEQCDKPCNGGRQARFRILLLGQDGQELRTGDQQDCPGDQLEERSCNVQACNQGGGFLTLRLKHKETR